jgi:hypothetical protein
MGSERQQGVPAAAGGGTRPPRRPATTPAAMTALAGMVGNRSMGSLLQRAPTSAPVTTAAGQATPAIPVTTLAPTRAEVEAAEAWVLFIAQRGRVARPSLGLPDRYKSFLESLNNAVWGDQDAGKVHPVADAKWFLKELRSQHDQLVQTKDHQVFDLADLALKRAAANASKDAAFEATGATETDVAVTLAIIRQRADEELAGAKEMGYTIPDALTKVSGQANARFDAAAKTWDRRAPNPNTVITPTQEADLVAFRDAALQEIGSARAKRAADLARYQRAEADAVRAAADKHLVELRAMMADRRRALFLAGKAGELRKLHDATGQIVGVIDEMKATAAIITDRVDQLNAIAQMTTTSGNKIINLPELPKGLTGAAEKLKGAHEKLGKILELLDVLGPAKTDFEGGMKYLKGIDMALDHFSGKVGNPIFAVYVNSYLRPALQNCMAQMGKIAGIISDQNRSAIGAGHPEYVMNWKVEPGGEGAYLFLAQVFKVGGAAEPNDEAWSFLTDNDDDLEAAVGEAMPKNRRTVGPWASRNRSALWEAFYGSTRPPR